MSDEREKRQAADVLARCSEEERARLLREAFARLGQGTPSGVRHGSARFDRGDHGPGVWC